MNPMLQQGGILEARLYKDCKESLICFIWFVYGPYEWVSFVGYMPNGLDEHVTSLVNKPHLLTKPIWT